MTRYLVATTSVHTTAAACDYLQSRIDGGDEVLVLAVREPALGDRDPGDAANVARTRLVAPSVETVTREGEPAEEVRALAAERDVDVVVVGPRRGDPETSGTATGSTVRELLVGSSVPVVVLPETALP
jgi:nucleotide-binding universal stress UspA family protein